jgi:hypothetical protein
VYLSVTAATLVVLVLAFGWIEDFASRRRPRLLPQIPPYAATRMARRSSSSTVL